MKHHTYDNIINKWLNLVNHSCILFSLTGYPLMSKALNATGRPIGYSCSWPAYQGGLPPKVSEILIALFN